MDEYLISFMYTPPPHGFLAILHTRSTIKMTATVFWKKGSVAEPVPQELAAPSPVVTLHKP